MMRNTRPRVLWLVLMIGLATGTIAWSRQTATSPKPPAYAEPVVLASQDGVLEVVLSAKQGEGHLDTVDRPVTNMLLFSYQIVKGTASNGQLSGQNLYPAPTLNVQPGQTLIVHLENQLVGLEIEDFFDPAYTAVGKDLPAYPPPIANPPFNLHTHGLHVSPMGNSDNVLLMLPAGARNTYSFKLGTDHPQGMYWYHRHLHGLTTAQTYYGLAGLLIVGRADGNIEAVTKANLPIRSMAIQYNMVANRQGGQNQLTNPNWPQFVSTVIKPEPGQVESGDYQPWLAPVNFPEAAAGTLFVTNWYAGPLSIDNHRGQLEMIPNNLIDFQSADGTSIPANPSLPDSQRDVQFTINGQFQPKIATRPGQTEIWVLANISDMAYVRVRLTETATGDHPPLVIVGQDGLPYPKVQISDEGDGQILSIPPASRYAIAVTIPQEGELILEMPPATDLRPPFEGPGVAYTSQGQGKPPRAVLGKVSVDPGMVSYFDGFFVFPTQVLVRAAGTGAAAGKTVAFTPGQELGAHTSFYETKGKEPAVRRSLVINGGFFDDNANPQEAKAFIYAFDGKAFPHTPLLRPRLDSIEEWSFINYNNDEHPIHIHVNDFQVTEVVDPVAKKQVSFQPWGQDNANVPAPLMGPKESVIAPGKLSLRTHFKDFLGSYVMHCHRLNHEDNGLMAMVNVIPAVSSYAVARSGSIEVRNGQGDAVLATVTPFPGYSGPLSLAMSDINGDAILDLVAGMSGANSPSQVVAYSGAGKAPFRQELARFSPFGEPYSGGINVAAGSLDGNSGAENIVVGSGPGTRTRVAVFSSRLPELGKAPEIVGDFSPYPDLKKGVTVSVGMVESASGLNSIVTAPGPGAPALVRAFRYEVENTEFCSTESGPAKIAEFLAFGAAYTGGVTLASDWTAGAEGGAQMVVVGQMTAPGEVRAYSTGSALDGFPLLYTKSPTHHDGPVSFRAVSKFTPFGPRHGVRVATTSTTEGANVLVSGVTGEGRTEVRKYQLLRAKPKAQTLSAKLLGKVASVAGSPGPLGGD